jgi:hypothetical protein
LGLKTISASFKLVFCFFGTHNELFGKNFVGSNRHFMPIFDAYRQVILKKGALSNKLLKVDKILLFYQSQFQSQVLNNEVPSSLIQLNRCLFEDRLFFLLQQQLNQQSLKYTGEPVFG